MRDIQFNRKSMLIIVSTSQAMGVFIMERCTARGTGRTAKPMNLEPVLVFLLAVGQDFLKEILRDGNRFILPIIEKHHDRLALSIDSCLLRALNDPIFKGKALFPYLPYHTSSNGLSPSFTGLRKSQSIHYSIYLYFSYDFS